MVVGNLKSVAVAAALGLAMAGAGGSAFAAEAANAQDRAGTATASAQGVADIHLAAELADWGRRSRSALALIEAAKILARTGGQDQAQSKTEEGPKVTGPQTPKVGKPEMTVTALLEEAKGLAGPDQYLQQQIAQVGSLQSKGRAGGPTVHSDAVNASATDVYHIRFRGGEVARIAVKGDGDTNLSLYVYDQNGHAICSDTDNDDRKFCQWTPAWTGSFTVKIANEGSVYNRYAIATN